MDSHEIKAHNRAVVRLRRIGTQLVEGPRSLLPPKQLDDFGWLEPDLRLIWRLGPTRGMESLIVYCDNTINRDNGFLVPVVRYARWDAAEDFATLPAWPQVEIQLGSFETRRDWVSEQVCRIEGALTHAPYIPFGLNTNRDVPEIEVAEERGDIEIHCSNGLQRMTWFSPARPPGDPLTDAFFAVLTELRATMEPMPRAGWQEVYDHDPTKDHIYHSWCWDGQAPKTDPE